MTCRDAFTAGNHEAKNETTITVSATRKKSPIRGSTGK